MSKHADFLTAKAQVADETSDTADPPCARDIVAVAAESVGRMTRTPVSVTVLHTCVIDGTPTALIPMPRRTSAGISTASVKPSMASQTKASVATPAR